MKHPFHFQLVESVAFSAQWGQQYLFYPWGLDVDASGNIYVADYMHNRVVKFDLNGNFVLSWGGLGTTNGNFMFPIGVAVDTSGNVYVSDHSSGNISIGGVIFGPISRVQKFSSNGAWLASWGGMPGAGKGQFDGAMGVACDHFGHVYVAEATNERIQKLDANGSSMKAWGGSGSADGQFNEVCDVASDSVGNVYVVDSGNNRIQKFDSNGVFLGKWGTSGSGDGQFNRPQSIATSALGHIHVADCLNNRIQAFDSSGGFLYAVGMLGSGSGQFNGPAGIAADSTGLFSGHVFVADSGNNRIESFTRHVTLKRIWSDVLRGE